MLLVYFVVCNRDVSGLLFVFVLLLMEVFVSLLLLVDRRRRSCTVDCCSCG